MTTAMSVRDFSDSAARDSAADYSLHQQLSFFMAGEEYAVNILSVQEIRGWETPTALPNAPAHVKGVINLRGLIVPVLDLRNFFGLGGDHFGAETVVIILNGEYAGVSRVLGIVVDAVSEVINVAAGSVKSAPDFGARIDVSYLQGLVNQDQRVVILLDALKLLEPGNLEYKGAGGV